MNISITNLCNRRCAYCFQKQWYLSKKSYADTTVNEMPLDMLKEVILWGIKDEKANHPIKLMGGEPLLYSKILEALDFVESLGKKVGIISNISVDSNLFKQILSKKSIEFILANTDYPAAQRDLFLINLARVARSPIALSLSTTLLADPCEQEKSVTRLLECIEVITYVNPKKDIHIRIAPYCPLDSQDLQYKTHNYTIELVSIFNRLLNACSNAGIGFDCPLEDAEVSLQAQEAFAKGGIRIAKETCVKTGGAFDILTDGSVIWCSSCEDIKLPSFKDYSSITEAQEALKKIVQSKYGKLIKENVCLAKARIKNAISIARVE